VGGDINATIIKTINGGSTWTILSSGLDKCLSSVYFTDANTGYAVGENGSIIKTINGGTTWTVLSSGTTNWLNSVYFTDNNAGYVVGSEGNILKTMNGGAIWSTLPSGTYEDFFSVFFTDANTGYIVSSGGTILKTIDAGTTWTKISSGTTYGLCSVYFPDANTGYAVGSGGTIIKTINGGDTWSALSSGTTNWLWSVHFTDTNTGYVVGDGGTILKTTNGGGIMSMFNSSTTIACVQEIVNFYDQSVGGVAGTWEWAFEGGSPLTSTDQNPQVFYNTSGIYDVSLTVSDGVGLSTINIEDYITVYGIPQIPETPAGENEITTNLPNTAQYQTSGATYAESYFWEILPAEAGTISGEGLIGTVIWTQNWEGTATIKVRGYNELCGFGEFSESYNVVCHISGISNQAVIPGIRIYPNPSKGIILISFDRNLGMTEISVTNLLNKVVCSDKTETMTGKTLNIDLSEFPNGVYFFKLKSDYYEGTRKIVIQ
jgi:photosystem II stability/assembly factor-like uncharacterized protein